LTVLGILAVLWIIQVINNADGYRLSIDYGIEPHQVSSLPYIFTAPLLHWSWAHIEGNSVPLLVLGFLAAFRGIPKFLGVTAVVVLSSGLFVWLTSPVNADTVGASGVIFGWFGYVVVRGFFDHKRVDIVIGILIGINYISLFSLLFPAPHLSYEGHIGGLVGGLACGWIFRTRPPDPGVGNGPVSVSPKVFAAPEPAPSSPVSHIDSELASLKQQIIGEREGPRDPTER
jgi:membrane associated rhomboid family serine protease